MRDHFDGVKGAPLDIRASKVVAGLEPENTNMFLLALVECATDNSYDSNASVRRCLAGEQPGDGPPAKMKVPTCCMM